MFKKMEQQKRRERIKDYEKQEKRLKELKAAGQSKKKAESKQKEALTRKQEKNKTKLTKNNDEDTGPQELLERPKEYQVLCLIFKVLNSRFDLRCRYTKKKGEITFIDALHELSEIIVLLLLYRYTSGSLRRRA